MKKNKDLTSKIIVIIIMLFVFIATGFNPGWLFFLIITIILMFTDKKSRRPISSSDLNIPSIKSISLKCRKCGSEVNPNDKFCFKCGTAVIPMNAIIKCKKCGGTLSATLEKCPNCGSEFNDANIEVTQDTSPVVNFDVKYLLNEKQILKNMIEEELKNRGELAGKLVTKNLNIKKNILLGIFGVSTLINVILYYFNYSFILCIGIEIFEVLLYLLISRKINIMDQLINRAMQNPDEDIFKIVNDIINEKKELILSPRLKFLVVVLGVVIIPSLIFFNPKIIYTKYGDGYQVYKYTKGLISNKEVTIPSTYKGKKVLAVGEGAFKNSNVKKVVLSSGIESIKTKAFYNANQIEKIEVPSSVTEIRAYAFANMNNLTYITLADGLKEIRGGAFSNDHNLTNVILPSTLEYLGGSAFSHCSSITEMTIPEGVTEINGQTFEYMTSLETIHLHEGITYIHGEVFVGDVLLDNVKLPSQITEIKGSTFEGCSSLKSIEIPEGVTRIGGHAFHGCTSLNYVYVPKSVNEIGSSAFRQCYSLNSITIPRNAYVNDRAFKESPTYISYYEY